jgi:hypothetical protein
MCVCLCVCIHTHTDIHTYIHTYAHIYRYPGLDDEKKCKAEGHIWGTTYEHWDWIKLKDVVSFFIDSVTIIVVAGLPYIYIRKNKKRSHCVFRIQKI